MNWRRELEIAPVHEFEDIGQVLFGLASWTRRIGSFRTEKGGEKTIVRDGVRYARAHVGVASKRSWDGSLLWFDGLTGVPLIFFLDVPNFEPDARPVLGLIIDFS